MDIDYTLPIASILSAIIIAAGWIISYRLNLKKSILDKKREVRIKFLIDAYQIIAFSANRKLEINEKKEFEKAIEMVEFLGSSKQLTLLEDGINTRNFTPLLFELRKEIRENLNLEEIDMKIKHFRFEKDN